MVQQVFVWAERQAQDAAQSPPSPVQQDQESQASQEHTVDM